VGENYESEGRKCRCTGEGKRGRGEGKNRKVFTRKENVAIGKELEEQGGEGRSVPNSKQ